MIIETEPHVCIEIGTHATFFFMVKMASSIDHGRRALNDDDDDDVAQHGGHPANTKSCSLGLQHTSLILNINPGLKINQIRTFSPIQMLFAVMVCRLFVYTVMIKTQNRKPNNIQKISS